MIALYPLYPLAAIGAARVLVLALRAARKGLAKLGRALAQLEAQVPPRQTRASGEYEVPSTSQPERRNRRRAPSPADTISFPAVVDAGDTLVS